VGRGKWRCAADDACSWQAVVAAELAQQMNTAPQAISPRLYGLRALVSRLERVGSQPALSYAVVAALQLRVVWNLWRYKDFTPYDTANYFVNAASWAHGLHESIIYSPLYAAIWGTTLSVVHDVYATAAVNRLAIILAVSLLVLATMRALFVPAIALLIAIWWVVNPANYNVLYDVHLLGLAPVLIAALVVARVPRRSGLGVALALLVADTVLLRNEMLLASLIFAVAILVYELRTRRNQPARGRAYLIAYGVPLLIASLFIGGAYWRSYIQGDEARAAFEAKQTTNLCEAYAFNYQQRYPSRVPGDAFLNCQQVMHHDFGRPMPNLFQAVVANPRAIAGFIAWNAQLLPSGTEVALFDATSTGKNPAYPAPRQHRKYAFILAILLIGFLVAGLGGACRERQYWRHVWIRSHLWTLILLGSAAIGTFVVVLTERPWVDYMYPFTFAVLVLVGVSASAILRLSKAKRLVSGVVGVLAALLIVVLPSYYSPGPRPIHDAVKRVQVIRHQLQVPTSVLVAARYSNDICDYLAKSSDRYCSSVDWPTLDAQLAGGASVQQVLNRAKATAIYADATMVADPALSRFLAAPRRAGWQQIASGKGADGPWRVLIRIPPRA
jgi:hypothetical protein